MAKEKTTIEDLQRHYMRGRQDMDTRRTRKGGWNDIISAYMGKLPANWPFLSVVTDPRLRTTITEKSARLINSKLRGRLVPREGGDTIKAKINNALLDFQWDYANEGGSMVSKVALADQTCRLFGAAFAFVYWDVTKNSNEIKIIDPRDIFFDGAATTPKNARWVQVREFTTWEKLAARGYDVKKLKKAIEQKEVSDQWRSTSYESIVKANRGLMDRVGEPDDIGSPIVEVITEWTNDGKMSIFLPRFGEIVAQTESPYKHGKIPVVMLRYYPLLDDIYGESDAEHLLPLQKAINATLCGFVDEMTIAMRPPVKVSSTGVRMETIEYGPGAVWVMDNPAMAQEMVVGNGVVGNFNSIYPALISAFNTAAGDNSLGVSNVKQAFSQKTATEIEATQQQQQTRDQNNQLYLSEFLKDIMLMWLANNKQYLLDDPTQSSYVLKVIGKDGINELKALGLGEDDIPDEAMSEIRGAIDDGPDEVSESMVNSIGKDVSVPKYPVITNPEEINPENYIIKNKLELLNDGEANLYITEDDFAGEYDYIPDVQSMALGAVNNQRKAMQQALQLILNPSVQQMIGATGESLDVKDLIINILEDAGMTDAQGLFKPNGQNTGGQQAVQPGAVPNSPNQLGGVPGVPQAVPNANSAGGLPQPQGVPNAGEVDPGLYA